ncbi:P pilus assembly protein, chaperone PapD [Anabaena sp. CCY 9910]|uniref:P pilus assembly protein, chaperone PapD n=1 Tax=Anabaena sp. CCY 9910 TaxID=3103870 RepID=UPI0039E12F7E
MEIITNICLSLQYSMQKTVQKLLPLLTTLALSSIPFLPEIAQAQIRYSPLIIEANAQQGQARGIIEVTNGGKQPFRGRIYAEAFTYNRNGFVPEKSNPQDLTPFLTFSPRELVIEPGQTRRIRLVSQFLPSTPTGEYRAVIFTEGLEEVQTQGQYTVGIKPRFGITMYVRQGNVSPNLTIQSASFNPQTKKITLLLNNKGTASIFPNTIWTLKQGTNTVATGESKDYTVIAGGERDVALDFAENGKKVVAGEYELTGNLVWGDREKPQKLPFNFRIKISPEAANTANAKTP